MKHNFCILFLLLFAYCCSAQVVFDTRTKRIEVTDSLVTIQKGSFLLKSKFAAFSYNSATKLYIFYGHSGFIIDQDNLNNTALNGYRNIDQKESILLNLTIRH